MRVRSTNSSAARPTINLALYSQQQHSGDAHWAIRTSLPFISIEGLALVASPGGILFAGSRNTGVVEVSDCVFRSIRHPGVEGAPADPSLLPCISAGHVASVHVLNSLFDRFDRAFLPSGPIGSARFVSNTLTGGNANSVSFSKSLDWVLSDCVFSRDWPPGFFPSGTTDIMIGGKDSRGSITRNEIGWRGEHPGSPDGCAIDYEGVRSHTR